MEALRLKYYLEDSVRSRGTLAIKFPMNGAEGARRTTFNMSTTTEEQAISNVVNVLFTFPGERFMQPNFGVGIAKYLFENTTNETLSKLRGAINQQMSLWLPYIRVLDLVVGSDIINEHQVSVSITFSVTESGANFTITLFPSDGQVQYTIS